MDQNLNNSEHEFLWTLLANRANDAHLYTNNLQQLVADYPQSGILRALLAHASDEKNLRQASVYFNSKSLYKLINSPLALTGVDDERIFIQTRHSYNGDHHPGYLQDDSSNVLTRVDETDTYFSETDVSSQPQTETTPAITGGEPNEIILAEQEPGQPVNEIVADDVQLTGPVQVIEADMDEPLENQIIEEEEVSPVQEQTLDDEMMTEEAANDESSNAEIAADTDARPAESGEEQPGIQINEEIYDEIVGIEDISINPGAAQPPANDGENATAENMTSAPEDELPDNLFMFDREFGEYAGEDDENETPASAEGPGNDEVKDPLTAGHQDLARYNDEKMPYTFMWWLDKTRKEHAGTYQPYMKTAAVAANKKPKKDTDELQQQYFENIFHITSVDDLDKNAAHPPAPYNVKRKEQAIIERFIKEEPQIKPQSSDKLDNENKAKKSSEDRDELVTETLASIYSDQMLYHKAIASYKKLMLKFPEKSRYFAGKIEQLEKKTN